MLNFNKKDLPKKQLKITALLNVVPAVNTIYDDVIDVDINII